MSYCDCLWVKSIFVIWKGDDIILSAMVGNDEYWFRYLNFVNVGMPRWFYDLECNSRLWIVTHMIYEPKFWN